MVTGALWFTLLGRQYESSKVPVAGVHQATNLTGLAARPMQDLNYALSRLMATTLPPSRNPSK